MKKNDMKNIMEKLNDIQGKEEKIQEAKEILAKVKGNYEDKSEDEILKEIEKIKEKVGTKEIKRKFKKHKKAIEQLENNLNDKQRERLKKVMEILDLDK